MSLDHSIEVESHLIDMLLTDYQRLHMGHDFRSILAVVLRQRVSTGIEHGIIDKNYGAKSFLMK